VIETEFYKHCTLTGAKKKQPSKKTWIRGEQIRGAKSMVKELVTVHMQRAKKISLHEQSQIKIRLRKCH
jgi:hypothetical protein